MHQLTIGVLLCMQIEDLCRLYRVFSIVDKSEAGDWESHLVYTPTIFNIDSEQKRYALAISFVRAANVLDKQFSRTLVISVFGFASNDGNDTLLMKSRPGA
jgi:hypothetical protein